MGVEDGEGVVAPRDDPNPCMRRLRHRPRGLLRDATHLLEAVGRVHLQPHRAHRRLVEAVLAGAVVISRGSPSNPPRIRAIEEQALLLNDGSLGQGQTTTRFRPSCLAL
ncbi:hypothetical protein KPL78_09355 [Roseomonas sp. HJA6]|uniref:Uncharacterized protein n=1 Tax=Roseomonas alba TaxID=2846776 RepID=A0ABS7A6W6_9PROT|nr:hypothetical protein [Neoroseomonas alba]